MYCHQGEKDGLAWSGPGFASAVEYYLRNDVGLRLQARIKVKLAPIVAKDCILLYLAKDRLEAREPIKPGSDNSKSGSNTDGTDDLEVFVLIYVRELF